MMYKLDKILQLFIKDEDLVVQKSMSSSLHEIAIMLGQNAFKILADSLVILMNSDEEIILNCIYLHLGEILQTFALSEGPKLV